MDYRNVTDGKTEIILPARLAGLSMFTNCNSIFYFIQLSPVFISIDENHLFSCLTFKVTDNKVKSRQLMNTLYIKKSMPVQKTSKKKHTAFDILKTIIVRNGVFLVLKCHPAISKQGYTNTSPPPFLLHTEKPYVKATHQHTGSPSGECDTVDVPVKHRAAPF